jgi:TetR/AcrR family transcriptional regulator, fatty acid metabolism regulator protein
LEPSVTASRSPRAAPPKVAEAHEPEKRRAILHAAVRVFAERGYHGCRIADVARAAGVAYGLVYHYFRNKDELLESVFAEQWSILINALKAIHEGPGSASDKIGGVCRFVMDVFKTAPSAVRVLILEVTRTPNALRAGSTPQTFSDALRILADIVAQGQRTGELRGDVEPLMAAAGVLGTLEMTLTGLVMGVVRPPSPSEEEIDHVSAQVVSLALAALRA